MCVFVYVHVCVSLCTYTVRTQVLIEAGREDIRALGAGVGSSRELLMSVRRVKSWRPLNWWQMFLITEPSVQPLMFHLLTVDYSYESRSGKRGRSNLQDKMPFHE